MRTDLQPHLFEKAIKSGDSYDAAIRTAGSREAESLFFVLAIDDLHEAAKIFEPACRRSRN